MVEPEDCRGGPHIRQRPGARINRKVGDHLVVLAFDAHPTTSPGFGAGLVTWWDTASANGNVVGRSGTGWYKVDPDCTGAIYVTEPSLGQAFTLEFFVGKNSDSIYQVNVDTVNISNLGTVPAVVLGMVSNRVNGR